MATKDTNLNDRSGSLVEAYKSYDPRIVFFYFAIAALLVTLVVGLGHQQLRRVGDHANAERQQNQRRILYPGPRGNIYDRHGKLLVGNNHRFAVLLHLDELKSELRAEWKAIHENYKRASAKKERPSDAEIMQIARVTLVQRYLDRVNRLLGRDEKVDAEPLKRHFRSQLLLPYTLVDNLTATEYARLIEGLPVSSPLEVYAFNVRSYPHGSAAAHVLGYVRPSAEVEAEDFPGADLTTFKMKGTTGRDGLEREFDATLQGEAGGRIYRVDPAGYKINPPLAARTPTQGKHLFTSLDIDMQIAAEKRLAEYELAGAAVALDVNTGEVLVLASKPDYNLQDLSPRIFTDTFEDIEKRGAWLNRATQGLYMPGSSFKILVSIAGLRAGVVTPTAAYTCAGVYRVGNHPFPCHDRHVHGVVDLGRAIEKSCNVYYYQLGLELGPELIAAEARRFRLDRQTGIQLPHEARAMLIPDRDWKKRVTNESWTGGDTANMAIGQGAVTVTPLQMACFAASVARDEIWTQPTLLHQPDRARQKHEKIGLTEQQRALLLDGMERVTKSAGTAHVLTDNRGLELLPVRIAGKTGTAQKRTEKGTINFAWFIGFAPVDNPEVAFAIAIEGDTPGEETGGGRYAGPVAHAILKAWLEKKNSPDSRGPLHVKSE